MTFNVAAAVGSNQQWNDDFPSTRPATVDLSAPRPLRGLREIDISRNNLRFAAGEKTLADNSAATDCRRPATAAER